MNSSKKKDYYLWFLEHHISMSSDGPDFQIKQDLLTYARFFRLSKRINLLKRIDKIEVMDSFFRTIGNNGKEILKVMEGTLFPKDIDEMCRMPDVFEKPVSFKSELTWLFTYFRSYSKQIKEFLVLRNQFEHSLLIGNFGLATHLLDEVRDKFGVSLWYYESKALLLEYEDKRETAVLFLSETLEKVKNQHSYIIFLLASLNERCTKDLSAYKYDSDLAAIYKTNKTDLHEDSYKYYLFRLNFFNNYENIDLSLPVMFESVSSLIDRYLVAVMTMKAAFIRKVNLDMVGNQAKLFYQQTEDPELIPMLQDKHQLPGYYNHGFVEILDLYYSGQYKTCAEKCIQFIKTDSRIFDIYVIYVRCLVYSGSVFRYPLSGDNIPLNNIIQKLYNIQIGKDTVNSLYGLYQINKNFYSFHIASSFHHFVKREKNEPSSDRLPLAYNVCFDPRYALSMNKESGLRYLHDICPDSEKHLCCNRIISILNGEVCDSSLLNDINRHTDKAMASYRQGDYAKSCHEWEVTFRDCDYIPVRKKAACYIIDCLFRQKQIDLLIQQYVDIYTMNPTYVTRVNTKQVIQYLRDILYEGITRNIDLIIFIGLNSDDTLDVSYMLYDFCLIYGKEKPSQLLPVLVGQNKDKVESFLVVAKDDEILSDYINITNVKQRLEERKAILEQLMTFGSPRQELYEEELRRVEDALVVHQVNRNMDEHKIYANVSAIMKNELKDIDGLYLRYKSYLKMLLSKVTICYVDYQNSNFIIGDYGSKMEDNVDISVNNNGLYDIFRSLYATIKDRFLNSEYGIVAYLSTRVRHGELEGELRPLLSKSHLILSLSGPVYQPTDYWKNEYMLNKEDDTNLNNALASFSEAFDKAVQSLIKQKLQIYDEDHPDGLFVYLPNKDELYTKAVEIGIACQDEDTKDMFCQKVIDWLWQMTNASLDNIRSYMLGDFSVQIDGFFDQLRKDVTHALPRGHACDEIVELISRKSVEMNSKIKKVVNWFNVSGVSMDDVDFISLSEEIFKCIVLANPQHEVTGTPEYNGLSFKIKSHFVLHYTYLLKNLLSNMIKHGSECEPGIKNFEMVYNIHDKYVEMLFNNDVPAGCEEALNKKLKEKLESKYFFGEGGSGIPKISKILRSDLPGDFNSLKIWAEEGKCYSHVTFSKAEIIADGQ